MRDLAALSEQIRTVREAGRRFMSLWRVEQVLVGPDMLDRVADDLAEIAAMADEVLAISGSDDPDGYAEPRNWSINQEDGRSAA